ncbi:MAG: hypothetical protein KDC34_19250 [Saprospiraceae bacterium]|nr:hypothetical protein [Saprospiraceae bacterium]
MLANFRKNWTALWNPNMYHGWGKEQNYFEGWYFKWVDPEEQIVLAIIPGISKGPDGEQHAFVQVFDGVACKAWYLRFEASEFKPHADQFALDLGNNYFSAEMVRLDLPNLKGEIRMQALHPWPKMLGAPGIMGWYSFVPFMQCYHGVVSLHHRLEGSLEFEGRTISFTGGTGYGEKDWGRSFPSAWIWMQSNHFGVDEPICLMASVANIPWLGSSFVGYIVGFLFEGELHRFATYTGAKMSASYEDKGVRVVFYDKKKRLEIFAIPAAGTDLVSPLSGEMTGKVNESLQATLEVRFEENGVERFRGTGRNAGLELAGALNTLIG